jgi:aspartyl aminopeptidase
VSVLSAESGAVNASLLEFLACPSPYHAVAATADALLAASYVERSLSEPWDVVVGGSFVRRGGALIGWWTPADCVATAPLHIVGAHSDSPNLRLKPRPDTGGFGWRQMAVEIYGGALLNSWLDRDLGLSGRVVTRDGAVQLVLVAEAIARVPQLAIHLDRSVGDGLVLDRQAHMTPIIGLGDSHIGDVMSRVASSIGVAASDVASFDLMLHDLTAPSVLGLDGEFIASGRIDNLASCHGALNALLSVRPSDHSGHCDHIAMMAIFDHEEVGSQSSTGAAGPLLRDVITRHVASLGGTEDDMVRALAASRCCSADMAHGVHPNYPDRHEPGHRPLPNGGPVIKVNATQRYATDAVSAQMFIAACERAGVPHQVFVSKNSMPCGSTIGPITSTQLGIATVDVGCAMLSMHSARELMGSADQAMYIAALAAWLN